MKYAAMTALGGELIDAASCDLDSWAHMVPLCPHCKEPVFFRPAQARDSKRKKPFIIPAHWSHFKSVSREQAAQCENRVKQYKRREIQKINRQAYEQRLRWLKRWFWTEYCNFHIDTYELGLEDTIRAVTGLIGNKGKKVPNLLWYFRERERQIPERERYRARAEVMIRGLIDGPNLVMFPKYSGNPRKGFPTAKIEDLGGIGFVADNNQDLRNMSFLVYHPLQKDIKEGTDAGKLMSLNPAAKDWHIKLTLEVLDFLYSDINHQDIWISLMGLGVWELIEYADQNKDWNPPCFIVERPDPTLADMYVRFDIGNPETMTPTADDLWLYDNAMLHLVVSVAAMPWAQIFQRLEKEKGKAA